MVRQTDMAQMIELAADRARYDECAKKLLTYKAVIAWILKSCTKEFSRYAEVSKRTVHQDQLDAGDRLNGDPVE